MRIFISIAFIAALAHAQTKVDLKSQSKNVDFSTALATLPSRAAASDPSVCRDGESYWNTTTHKRRDCNAGAWVDAAAGSTNGSGAPAAACNSSNPGALYADTGGQDAWWCDGAAWQRLLSTYNSGPFTLTGQTGTSPATPSAGAVTQYFDGNAKVPQAIDDAGNKSTMVRPNACAGQVVQSVGTDGTITCAAGGESNNPAVLVSSATQGISAPTSNTTDTTLATYTLPTLVTGDKVCIDYWTVDAGSTSPYIVRFKLAGTTVATSQGVPHNESWKWCISVTGASSELIEGIGQGYNALHSPDGSGGGGYAFSPGVAASGAAVVVSGNFTATTTDTLAVGHWEITKYGKTP
jgi:hypothetical protein